MHITGDFIREAYRILKADGILKIAEVRSRFDDNSGTGIKKFCKFLKRAGFNPLIAESSSNCSSDSSSPTGSSGSVGSHSTSSEGKKGNAVKKGSKVGPVQNKMFFEVECRKSDRACSIDKDFVVKPCVYKKR